jgi:hypothetical protein
LYDLRPLEQFFENRCFTRVYKLGVKSVDNEIEKRRQRGETVSFGVLLVIGGHTGEKGQDLILCD